MCLVLIPLKERVSHVFPFVVIVLPCAENVTETAITTFVHCEKDDLHHDLLLEVFVVHQVALGQVIHVDEVTEGVQVSPLLEYDEFTRIL